MAEELSWKYDARKGCEKTITLGAYSLVISKWHVYHVFEQDWLQRGLIFTKVSWMCSLKFRILGEPKLAVYLRYKKGVIIPGGKKTTSPHFMLLTNYASFIISTLCMRSSSSVVAPQLTWTFFLSQKKAPLSPSPLGLVCFERDKKKKVTKFGSREFNLVESHRDGVHNRPVILKCHGKLKM